MVAFINLHVIIIAHAHRADLILLKRGHVVEVTPASGVGEFLGGAFQRSKLGVVLKHERVYGLSCEVDRLVGLQVLKTPFELRLERLLLQDAFGRPRAGVTLLAIDRLVQNSIEHVCVPILELLDGR